MSQDETVSLREITEATLRPYLKLEVTEQQKAYVAPNAVSIAQAHFSKYAWFRAIYAGETPVGFVMLHIDTEKPEYWVWRLMIDRNHQKRDYGYRAMQQVIAYVRALPGAAELRVSYEPGPGDPSVFYAKLGFVETGETTEDERVMLLTL